jgi:predicted porin
MKKSLIALAVLAASGASFAQSSVTLYGIADVVIHKDKDVTTKMSSGGVSGSRLGFKGSEDLGGGLSAIFLLERGFAIDTGVESGGFNRQAYVGLAGGFGEVKLGNVYTAYDDISGATNPVFDSVLSPTNVWASTGYTSNPTNNMYYATPSLGGVSGALSTNVKEGGESVSAFHVKYEGGPVYAGVAYQKEGDVKFTRLNGSYDLGAAKLLAGYGNVKNGSAKTNEYTLGADVPLSPSLVLSAGYASSKADGGVRASGVAVGVAYSVSKRTTVYGGYLDTKDSSAPESRFGLGLKHTF